MIKKSFAISILLVSLFAAFNLSAQQSRLKFFPADHEYIQYTGRIDFKDPKRPRFWAPGVYIQARYRGSAITIHLDEEGAGTNNYLEIVIDHRVPFRVKLQEQTNSLTVGTELPFGEHTILICKNTEANIGSLTFRGLTCDDLLQPAEQPTRKLEFIGNSITCGTGADTKQVPCGTGKWHDQHNAYMSYGPRTARALSSQWVLSAYSGIGMIHSCCNLPMTMPAVYDKVNMRDNTLPWDFSSYQPDAVTICLGQNDGIQDSTAFTRTYVTFIESLRSRYPSAQIVCLTSPMGDEKLTAALKNYLTGVVDYCRSKGDTRVTSFFFVGQWIGGCDSHPTVAEHEEIARQLTGYLKNLLHW